MRDNVRALKELEAICNMYQELYEYKLPWWWFREKRDRYVLRFVVKHMRMNVLKIYDPWPWPDVENQYGIRAGDDIS
jgi:hypothetical protein